MWSLVGEVSVAIDEFAGWVLHGGDGVAVAIVSKVFNGLRGNTETVEKLQDRLQKDLFYIENWSILFDLKIIMLTPPCVVGQKNAY